VALAMALAAGLLTACSPHLMALACKPPPASVTDPIMATARTHFRSPPGARVDHLTFARAAAVPIPRDDQRFGAVTILMIAADTWKPRGEPVAAVVLEYIFALDSTGAVVGPLDDWTARAFDVPTPKDSDWAVWAAQRANADDDTPTALAFDCVMRL